MDITFNTYYTYAELTERLAWLAGEHGGIMQLAVLGKSHEGRDIPLVILTNRETGPDIEKPAFWIDANIHATEVTASMAALYFIKKLVDGYGTDPKITRMMDEQVVYVAPRLNPDGAELALAEQPRAVRSGTRPYPIEDKQDGLHAEDIDGDGRILQMRIADPSGEMKAVRPVRLELELPGGATLKSGKPAQEIGHLEGRSNKLDVAYYGASPTDNRGKAEWLIHAPGGGTLTLCASAERGGTIRQRIQL